MEQLTMKSALVSPGFRSLGFRPKLLATLIFRWLTPDKSTAAAIRIRSVVSAQSEITRRKWVMLEGFDTPDALLVLGTFAECRFWLLTCKFVETVFHIFVPIGSSGIRIFINKSWTLQTSLKGFSPSRSQHLVNNEERH
jgi:hypothetical protein